MREELEIWRNALEHVTTQSTRMQVELMARVGHKLQAQTAQQHCQAEVNVKGGDVTQDRDVSHHFHVI